MLRTCSQRLSKMIISGLGYEKYDPEILRYGLEILLGMAFKFFSIVAISLALGTFGETMFSLLAFALIRNFAGGVHLKTYGLCYTTGVLLFALNGLTAKHMPVTTEYFMWANNFLFIISLFITLKWVPAGTEKKVVSNPYIRRRLQGITILVLGFMFILSQVFFYTGKLNLVKAIMLGVSEEMLFVTPLGYKMLKSKYH